MKTNEIKIGNAYLAMVTEREVPVRIDTINSQGGWDAINLSTGRSVRIKTAQRLLREVTKAELKNGDAPGMDKVPVRRTKKAVSTSEAKQAVSTKTAQRDATRANVAKPKVKLSGLDAAYRVLCESDDPLNAKQVVQIAADQGYWQSDAATPHATIHAAISREIKLKGDDSRFVKVDRGVFIAKQ
jgi:hypothetical protein